MYIKREPLGRGNLAFGKRRRRFSLIGIILYVVILAVALFVYFRMDLVQPRVLEMIGPPPAPTTSPVELSASGDAAYDKGKLDEAADWYRQAAETDPTNVELLTQYARLLTLNHQHEEALTVADQIIALVPEDPRGYATRARALDWNGDYDQALIEALHAIELDPNYAPGHAYAAEAYADLGRYRQAREQAELGINLDPYNVDTRRNYAYVLEFYGDYQGAIQQYLQALGLAPNLLDLWYGLARNYRGAGQMEKSVETYAQIAVRTPEDPYLYVEWGKTYFEMRDDSAAQETLQQAVDLVCAQSQTADGVAEDEQVSCPLVSSSDLFASADSNPWKIVPGQQPTPNQIPWDAANRPVPTHILISAWNRLGQVYLTRRNYEDVIAILSEAVAWGEAQDPNAPDYQNIPIETYYVMASAYYYKDECRMAVPLAVKALHIYEDNKLTDPGAEATILRLFVLCRDWTEKPETAYSYSGPGFTNGFPDGYVEPDVIIQRPGTESDTSSTDSTSP